jgi:pyridoxal 5'-phosphate synthase pdxT subunit
MHNSIIGILGIQGGFSKHQDTVNSLGYKSLIVKTAADLQKVDKLIIPGGESTTMRLLLKKHGLWPMLEEFTKTNPVFGTCAGAILLAKTINNHEESLAAIDINIKRNSYGRQIASFVTNLDVTLNHKIIRVPSMFIRAPQVTQVGSNVHVLAKYDNLPVLLQEQHIMVATFHPELTNDTTICDYFIHNVG